MNELTLPGKTFPVIDAVVCGILLEDWGEVEIEPTTQTTEVGHDSRVVQFATAEEYVYVKLEIIGTEKKHDSPDSPSN